MENKHFACPGFTLYWDDLEEYVQVLTEGQLGRVLRAVIEAGCTGTVRELKNEGERLAFLHIMNKIEEQKVKYRETVARNTENGYKRMQALAGAKKTVPGKTGC